jgi:hypothetical protein
MEQTQPLLATILSLQITLATTFKASASNHQLVIGSYLLTSNNRQLVIGSYLDFSILKGIANHQKARL